MEDSFGDCYMLVSTLLAVIVLNIFMKESISYFRFFFFFPVLFKDQDFSLQWVIVLQKDV